MGDVRLAEYIALWLTEFTDARTISDSYTLRRAEEIRDEPIKGLLPTSRWRIPRVDLTLPMLVSRADLGISAQLDIPFYEFQRLVLSHLKSADVLANDDAATRDRLPAELSDAIVALHQSLLSARGLGDLRKVVSLGWRQLLNDLQKARNLSGRAAGDLDLEDVEGAALWNALQESIKISRTGASSLIVEPDFASLSQVPAEAAIVTVRVSVQEEGIKLRQIRDAASGQDWTVVDFD